MNKKLIILGLIFLTVFPFVINVALMGWNTSLTHGTTESWIGFFASYAGGVFGGVIGGLFTYLGVKQTISTQVRQKYIDEFPEKTNLLMGTVFELKKQHDFFSHNEHFIKGYGSFENPSRYFDSISLLINESAEKGIKIDATLYENMKEIRNRKDKLLLKSVNNPLISLKIADDEFGTNERTPLETIKLREEIQAEMNIILMDLINILEKQLSKMEKVLKRYVGN
ncbi:hypothetical protein [Paenibacillus tundrae]|uniref:Protein xpaC n=1 Tax=Paenibacillus tundrae TaxID=528187 RepID=A0ABT9WB78_9BACL|nr:hypothetical protein [Paenibacillus tundrae]MDQ0170513.1 hypothetical protein [Paenibacillus tundrae]